jgi:hypothetical protein
MSYVTTACHNFLKCTSQTGSSNDFVGFESATTNTRDHRQIQVSHLVAHNVRPTMVCVSRALAVMR